jgi:hypothetical protein
VYVAALVLGNARLPRGPAIHGFAEGVAWLAQIGLFVMLGLQPDADHGQDDSEDVRGAATIRSFPVIASFPRCRCCTCSQHTRRACPQGEAVMVTGWRRPVGRCPAAA